MTLWPDKTIHKVLISTTSRLVGQYENDNILITHAWPNIHNRNVTARWSEGPASRSAYVLAFKTPISDEDRTLPDYSPFGDIICAYLSILYGKRFDCHGLIEGSGYFNIPNYSPFTNLCDHHLPQNSHSSRADYSFPLSLTEFCRFDKLITGDEVPDNFLKSFNAAGKCYFRALQNVEHDPEISYLHLITAGEILANFFKQTEQNIRDWNLLDEETLQHFQTIQDTLPNGGEIVSTFSNKMLKVKRGFVKTITTLVGSDIFGKTESQSLQPMLNSGNLEKAIAAAYDLRSLYVHRGMPFGKWVAHRMGGDSNELQFGRPILGDKTLENTLEKALTYAGLERIIRFCLLKFAEQNGALSTT